MDPVPSDAPPGWPGVPWIEGRTRVNLPCAPADSSTSSAPGTADTPVFHNPAMGRSRTRSIRLLEHIIHSGWLGDGEVRVLDALAASGLRARRWLRELPPDVAARLHVTLCERDESALAWARANLTTHGEAGLAASIALAAEDLRVLLPARGFQWIDLDPYGSPAPFLDAVLQATARHAVVELTATDAAALCGTSAAACRRRYGARPRQDASSHDTGLRILLATAALTAARHDRAITPLLSIWDGHHLRVSIRVQRSLERAGAVHQHLGWRVAEPTREERATSIAVGQLHPEDAHADLPWALLPWDRPPLVDGRVAGPLWIGPLHDADALCALWPERALESSALWTREPHHRTEDQASVAWTGWTERHVKLARREVERAVLRLPEEAALHDDPPFTPALYPVDVIAKRAQLTGPPSPRSLSRALSEAGHPSEWAHWGEPAIRTLAPWEIIITTARGLSQV